MSKRQLHTLYRYVFWLVALASSTDARAQSAQDTIRPQKDEFFLARKKGVLGQLGKSISTCSIDNDSIVKNELRFECHNGLIIRKIYIDQIPCFANVDQGRNWVDRKVNRVANGLHSETKERVLRRNFFFSEGQKVSAYLMADTERHLREQSFIQDAKIELLPNETMDSVDVYVVTKDVVPIGGGLEIFNEKSGEIFVNHENMWGLGDRLEVRTMYDETRRVKVGLGMEYVKRNLKGSFADLSLGYITYNNAFSSGRREENRLTAQIAKPMVSPYFRWTYTLRYSHHQTKNHYWEPSDYLSKYNYRYNNWDAWAAFNIGSKASLVRNDPRRRERIYLSARAFDQYFLRLPTDYADVFLPQYANISGLLGSFTIARQNFYKEKQVYGFGRNEDIPSGYYVSAIGGYTNKEGLLRSYAGIDLQRNYFTQKGKYFNFNLRFSTFLHKKEMKDIVWLANLDYFSQLKNINRRWKRRTFITGSVTGLSNIVLFDPLRVSSAFGLPEYRNGPERAQVRLTTRIETVFFNRWKFFGFKFAPLLFAGQSLLTTHNLAQKDSKIHVSLGAGLRSRNENLVFGTMQLKFFYFPTPTPGMANYRVDFTTDLTYKYKNLFIKKPEFIEVN